MWHTQSGKCQAAEESTGAVLPAWRMRGSRCDTQNSRLVAFMSTPGGADDADAWDVVLGQEALSTGSDVISRPCHVVCDWDERKVCVADAVGVFVPEE